MRWSAGMYMRCVIEGALCLVRLGARGWLVGRPWAFCRPAPPWLVLMCGLNVLLKASGLALVQRFAGWG